MWAVKMHKVVELQSLDGNSHGLLLGVDRMRLANNRLAGIMHGRILTEYIDNADAITTRSLPLRGRREFICMMQVPFYISISKGTNLLPKIFVVVVLPITACRMVYTLLQAALYIRLLVVNIVF
jgi:hypothetical protein